MILEFLNKATTTNIKAIATIFSLVLHQLSIHIVYSIFYTT